MKFPQQLFKLKAVDPFQLSAMSGKKVLVRDNGNDLQRLLAGVEHLEPEMIEEESAPPTLWKRPKLGETL